MVAGRSITLVRINYSLKGCLRILWHLFDDMNALIVLTLGVNNLYCFSVRD